MAEPRKDVERPDDPSKTEVVAAGVGVIALIGIVGAAVWSSLKEEKRILLEAKTREERRLQKYEEKKQWLNSEYADGNVVYELMDGSFLVVPRISEQKRVIK